MKKAVIILSGGMDSTTLAYDMKNCGFLLHALSFNYGQKHVRKLQCAMVTATKLKTPHEVVDLTNLTHLLKSSLTDASSPVPEGHYADENMKSTVVPNRNMIMLSIAAGYAISIGAEAIAYAAHAGDHAIYPDCRPEFRDAMGRVLSICHFGAIELYTPYIQFDKGMICSIGIDCKVPYEDTWTCYKGEEVPCGVCGACVERAEAFAENDMEDPLC